MTAHQMATSLWHPLQCQDHHGKQMQSDLLEAIHRCRLPCQTCISGLVRGENMLPWVLSSNAGLLLQLLLELFLININLVLTENAGKLQRRCEPAPGIRRVRAVCSELRLGQGPGLAEGNRWFLWFCGHAWPLACCEQGCVRSCSVGSVLRVLRIQLGRCLDGSRGNTGSARNVVAFSGQILFLSQLFQ